MLKQNLKRAWLGLAAAVFATLGAATANADMVINRFDASTEIGSSPKWHYDFGLGAGNQTLSYDTSEDAGGGATPGSMKMVMNFTGAGSFAYTADTFGTATNLTLANYTNISMQVKVAPGSVALGNGDAGYFKLVIRAGDGSYTYLQQYGANINTNNGWFTINVPITGDVTQTRAFTIEIYNSTAGTRTVWIDNLILKGGASSGGGTCETGLVINRFNAAPETSSWRQDFGVSGSTLAFDSAHDAGCGTANGSIKFVIPFSVSATAGTAFTTDCFASPGTNLPAGGYTNISMDILVDPSSAAYGDGTCGYLDIVLRTGDGSYNWTPQFGGNLNTNSGWRHFDIPLTGTVTGTRAITLQFSQSGLNGTRTIYVDNVLFKGAVSSGPTDPPPTCETGLVLNRFYVAGEVYNWGFDFGLTGSANLFATNNVDCGTYTNKGSLKLTLPFGTAGAGGYAFTKILPSAYTNLAALGYTNIAFDLKVDPSSPSYGDSSAGYFQFVVRTGPNWDWNPLFGGNLIVSNGWKHFDLPLLAGDLTDVRAFTMQFSDSGLTSGTRTIFFDNVVLKGPAVAENPPPAPLQCVVNAFDSASEVNDWRQGFGVPGILRQWSTNNFGTNLSSGSLKVTIPFDVGLYGNDNKGQVTKTLWLGGLNVTNYGFTHIAMDVKVDPASVTDAYGANGYFDAAFRLGGLDIPAGTNTSFEKQISGNINSVNGWVHYEVPVSGNLTNTWELTLQDYGAPGQNITGDVILYIDNIVLKGTNCYSVVSCPSVSMTVVKIGSNVNISWPSASGCIYQLQSKATLTGAWINDGSTTNGTGSSITLQRSISGTKFYRLQN